ncbi:phytoene desaturase family protein [Saliphagus sp. GCM10025334]
MGYDREFDGIVIGGGHQGLICAAYMAKAGMEILVLERELHVGGGLHTVDLSSEGFRYNLHSINHFNITNTPWYTDLNLSDHGVEYIEPTHEFAQPHSDGDGLILSKDRDRTIEVIRQFSDDDADQYAEMSEVANRMVSEIYLPERFDEPLPADERRQLLESSELGRTFLDWTTESAFDLVDGWYESDPLKALLLFKLSIFGEPGEGVDNPSHKGGIARCFDQQYTYQIARGGSQMLALGLAQVIQQQGGTVLTNSEVTSIDIEDGEAVGVELADGKEFGARRFVASAVNPHLTFEEFVGLDHLDESLAAGIEAEVKDFAYTDWSLLGTHFGLEEAPEYPTESVPEINNALKYNIGLESVDDILAAHESKVAKDYPVPAFGGGALTMFDETQAPRGKHTAYAWQVAPYDLHGDPEEWREVADKVSQRTLEAWGEYAPNMTEGNVVHSHAYTPRQIPMTNINMINGGIFIGALTDEQTLDKHIGYRTPIKNLFLCGSSAHPGGAINGGAGYVGAKVIHEKLGIDPWWNPIDVRESLKNLS